jgi:hypothetical protein
MQQSLPKWLGKVMGNRVKFGGKAVWEEMNKACFIGIAITLHQVRLSELDVILAQNCKFVKYNDTYLYYMCFAHQRVAL